MIKRIALLLCLYAAVHAENKPVKELRVFYFGNSLTANTMPNWHAELGKSAGKEWIAKAWLGAGWQLWQHREGLRQGGYEFDPSSQGDLTLDATFIASRNYHAKAFLQSKWDAIVLQAFSPHLELVTTQMWGKVNFDEPHDCGDIQSAADIMAFYLKMNPAGRVYIYQCWPPMRSGKGMDEMRGAEFPLRDQFDYEKQWMQPYVGGERPWTNGTSSNRTRDFNEKLFKALIGKYPQLWKDGRLRMIPAGDVYLALDEAMQAGKVPGFKTVGEFYTDVQHQRAGLARYTDAAVFYACLFGEHPGKLDWRIYNDVKKYGPDTYHDAGELLEITEERAKAVNDIIWQTVTHHPYTGLTDEND
jgi:hypothetical protein